MKRAIRIVVLACALTIGTTATTAAHTITVTNPHGDVVTSHNLAKGTPAHPDGTGSAASHGTNVACQAVGTDGPVLIIGGVCKP